MAGPCIAKIHEYEPALLLDFDTVVTSHRDLRDVLMSVSQTFGSCLDPQCSDQQTLDFSVAAHFKHYALWRRHAVYDMKYENMVKSPSSEVQAIALSLGIVCSKTVADSIVSKVLDFSAKAQESKNPWDKSTGFSKSHNHASAKVQAYLDKALVQNLSIPNGPCNLRKEFQTIEDRYSLWMNEMKYTGRSTARMDGSKQTELELNRNRNKNQAKEEYEEIETETETKDGLHKMSISHVINYFVHRGGTNRSDVDGKTRGFQSWEAALTQASIVDARSHAHAAGITVNVIAAIFPGDEDALGELESIATICYLKQQRTAFLKVSRNNRRMPLLTEILHCAGTRYTGEGNNPRLQEQVVVYTNADIGVQLDFYVHVEALMQTPRTAQAVPPTLERSLYSYSITRRELPRRKQWERWSRSLSGTRKALSDAYRTDGGQHRGHDCFIMPRIIVDQLQFGDVTIGFAPWGCMLSAVLHQIGDFRVQSDRRWTFHFGLIDVLPDVSPVHGFSCADALLLPDVAQHMPGQQLFDGEAYFVGQDPACNQHKLEGMCCRSCGRAESNCDWQKSYDYARQEQTLGGQWSETVANTLSALDALKTMAPKLINQCCSISKRGEASFKRLAKHWSNTKYDVSGNCCITAGMGFVNLPGSELMKAWCQTQWTSSDHHVVVGGGGGASNNVKPGGRLRTVLLHEQLPSTFAGGDSRALQVVQWLVKEHHHVTVVTRNGQASAGCTLIEQGTPVDSTFASTAPTNAKMLRQKIGKQERAYNHFLLAALGVTVVEDDLCLSEAAREGGVIGSADVIVSMLWFYRNNPAGLSMPSIPELVLKELHLHKTPRELPLHIVISDDIHYHRANFVAQHRNNVPERAKRVLASELNVYCGNVNVSRIFTVTDEDVTSIRMLCKKYGKVPPAHITMLPYLGTAKYGGEERQHQERAGSTAAGDGSSRSCEHMAVSTKITFEDGGPKKEEEAVRNEFVHGKKTNRFSSRSFLLYVGSGHVANVVAVKWLLEHVLPAFAFMKQFQKQHKRLPGLEECPLPFASKPLSPTSQLAIPRLLLTGAAHWKQVLADVRSRRPKWAKLLSRVSVSAGGFVTDLQSTLSRARILLAPNLLRGSGIGTKVMTGLENGIPVVANSGGAVGYGCPDKSPGRIKCKHLLITGPETKSERERGDLHVEAYWYARATLGLYSFEPAWTAQATAGLQFVHESRSTRVWDPILESALPRLKDTPATLF